MKNVTVTNHKGDVVYTTIKFEGPVKWASNPNAQWQPIETAPANQELLFYCAGKYGIGMGLGRHSIFETPDGSLFEPTHWMPLPEPPESVPFRTSES